MLHDELFRNTGEEEVHDIEDQSVYQFPLSLWKSQMKRRN